MKRAVLLCIVLLFCFTEMFYSQADFTSKTGSKLWDNSNSWVLISGSDADGVPDADDNVTIKDGAIMRIQNSIEYCNNLIFDCNVDLTTSDALLVVTKPGTLIISGDLTMKEDIDVSGSSCILDVADQGEVNISGNINMDLYSSVGGKIIMSASNGILNISGNFDFRLGQIGTLTGGAIGSTVTFKGAAEQTIPAASVNFQYCNIKVENTSTGGVQPDANLIGTNVAGNLTVSSGFVFDDNGFTVGVAGNLHNMGTYKASGNLDVGGDFINSGTFTSSGCNINVAGNWNNFGTYTYSDGDIVTFDGTVSTSTITGATNWHEMKLNNPLGVTVNIGQQNIYRVLDIEQGIFTSGNLVTLISNVTGTAQMADIGTGSFSGDLTVQRYFNKTAQSFTLITSPVIGTSLQDWKTSGVLFSGFPGSDYPSFSWNNAHTYDEASHGSFKANGWKSATDISNLTGSDNNHHAHYVYIDAISVNLSVTGVPFTGSVALPISYTSSGNPDEDGWNMIGNPYPCSVDWDQIYVNNPSGIMDGYYIYSGDNQNFSWYDGATTGSGVGSGGATKDIPHSQGVWIHSTGRTTLNIEETHKITTDAYFIKSSIPSYIRIGLTGNINTFKDEALILSDEAYNDAFDDQDIVKFFTTKPDYAPTLFTTSTDDKELTFNKVEGNDISIPMMAKSGLLAQGTYTLDFDIPVGFMQEACITLEDLHTGTITNLKNTPVYSYTTSDTTTLPRFIIHIVKNFNADIAQPSCDGINDGKIVLTASGMSGYNFELIDANGNSVASSIAQNNSVNFNNLNPGVFQLTTNYSGACGYSNFEITLDNPMPVSASFNFIEDTLYLNNAEQLQVNNSSQGSLYLWDFGDGNLSTDINPSHNYTSAGIYQVMLTADNDNIGVCTDITSKNIVVLGAPLAINENYYLNKVSVFVDHGEVIVNFDLSQPTYVSIRLTDINGKLIVNNQMEEAFYGEISLHNTQNLTKGIYFITITSSNYNITKKIYTSE